MKQTYYLAGLVLIVFLAIGGCIGDDNIKGAISNPPALLAGEQTTLHISTYFSGNVGSTLGLYFDNGTKIGDMKDDGKIGDDTANDKIYSILVPINEFTKNIVVFNIIASYEGNSYSKNISIPVIHIPKYHLDIEYNKAADDLYANTLKVKDMLSNIDSVKKKSPPPISPNLYNMFIQYEGITQQDIGKSNLFAFANGTSSCEQVIALFDNYPPDPRLTSLRQYIVSNSNGQVTMADMLDPITAQYYASRFILTHNIPATLGCEGGTFDKASNIIVKEITGEFTSLSGNIISNIYNGGTSELSKMAINEGIGIFIGWFTDIKGKDKIAIGKVNNETFTIPVGTYNMFYSSGGKTPMAVNKNVIVTSEQSTNVDFTPGTMVGGYTISGKVFENGFGLVGAVVTLSGFEVASATTDSSGAYSFSHIANGSYAITPSKLGVAITPASLSVTVNNSDISGLDFGTQSPPPPVIGKWTALGYMTIDRESHTATLLTNGKVLITGGMSISLAGPIVNSAELYDPSTGTFSATGSMSTARFGHTSTLLPNGLVLVTGGRSTPSGYTLSSAELYNPATGTFSATGTLNMARMYHSATLLTNGKVLISGGWILEPGGMMYIPYAELYDPATGTFSNTGNMVVSRMSHTATLLPNGKVLLAGGFGGVNFSIGSYLSSAELYDPSTETFSTTGSMGIVREGHTATLLPDGKVLVVGGFDGYSNDLIRLSELYDPAAGIFSSTGSVITGRLQHTATLLSNGGVLIVGGRTMSATLDLAEFYDSSTGAFSATASMLYPLANHTATLLSDGKVLITGSYTRAQLYEP